MYSLPCLHEHKTELQRSRTDVLAWPRVNEETAASCLVATMLSQLVQAFKRLVSLDTPNVARTTFRLHVITVAGKLDRAGPLKDKLVARRLHPSEPPIVSTRFWC